MLHVAHVILYSSVDLGTDKQRIKIIIHKVDIKISTCSAVFVEIKRHCNHQTSMYIKNHSSHPKLYEKEYGYST